MEDALNFSNNESDATLKKGVNEIYTVTKINDRKYEFEKSKNYNDNYKKLENISEGYLSKISGFIKSLIYKADDTKKNIIENIEKLNMIFRDYTVLVWYEMIINIYDMKMFVFDFNRDMKTLVPTCVTRGDDIKYFNEIGDEIMSTRIDKEISYFKNRLDFNNKLLYEKYLSINLEKVKKDYGSFLITKARRLEKDNEKDKYLLSYVLETPLNYEEICSYFNVNINDVLKLFITKYERNPSNVFKDFYGDENGQYFMDQFIRENILTCTKYLYIQFDNVLNREKTFLALFALLNNVSTTGLYLMISFLKSNIPRSNDLIYNYDDYDINKWGAQMYSYSTMTDKEKKEEGMTIQQVKIDSVFEQKYKDLENKYLENPELKPVNTEFGYVEKKDETGKTELLPKTDVEMVIEVIKENESFILNIEQEKMELKRLLPLGMMKDIEMTIPKKIKSDIKMSEIVKDVYKFPKKELKKLNIEEYSEEMKNQLDEFVRLVINTTGYGRSNEERNEILVFLKNYSQLSSFEKGSGFDLNDYEMKKDMFNKLFGSMEFKFTNTYIGSLDLPSILASFKSPNYSVFSLALENYKKYYESLYIKDQFEYTFTIQKKFSEFDEMRRIVSERQAKIIEQMIVELENTPLGRDTIREILDNTQASAVNYIKGFIISLGVSIDGKDAIYTYLKTFYNSLTD